VQIRLAQREQRRSLLEALPKATRVALEQHLVAQRAAATDTSSTCSTWVGPGDGSSDPSRCSGSTNISRNSG
jgi:hypothetical protein